MLSGTNSNNMAAVYTAIYNNHYSMIELFRHQETREQRFKLSLIKSHKSYGNDVFKYRHHQYFDQFKKDRYKTRHLLLREVHRALRGTITKQQMEKEKQELLNKTMPGGIEQIDMISAYPNKMVKLVSQEMVGSLNNEVERSQEALPTQQQLLKYESESQIEFDQDGNNGLTLGQNLQILSEMDDLSKNEIHTRLVLQLMDEDVNQLFTPQQFKKIMDDTSKDSVVFEIALRLASRFYDSVIRKVSPPVPNLGKTSMVAKRGADCDKMIDMLKFALQSIDRDLYTKLRCGEMSLSQVMARIHQTGSRPMVVLDDIRHDLHPSCLGRPSRYIEAAYKDQQLENEMQRTATKRGVDPKVLAATAKQINYNTKCVRSVYSKPFKKKQSPKQALNHIQYKVTQEQTLKNNKQIKQDYVKGLKQDQQAKWKAFEKRKIELQNQLKDKGRIVLKKSSSFAQQLNLPRELKDLVVQNERQKRQNSRNSAIRACTDLDNAPVGIRSTSSQAVTPSCGSKQQSSRPMLRKPTFMSKSTKITCLNDEVEEEIPELLKEKLEDVPGCEFLVRLADDYSDPSKHPDTVIHLPKKYYYKAPDFKPKIDEIQEQPQIEDTTSQAYKNFVEDQSNGLLLQAQSEIPLNLPGHNSEDHLSNLSPSKRHYIVLNSKTPPMPQLEEEMYTKVPMRNTHGQRSTTSDIHYSQKVESAQNAFQNLTSKEALQLAPVEQGSQRYNRPKSSVQLGGGARAYPRQKAQQLRKNVMNSTQKGCSKATRTSSNISVMHSSRKNLIRPKSNIGMRNSSAFSINGQSLTKQLNFTGELDNTTAGTKKTLLQQDPSLLMVQGPSRHMSTGGTQPYQRSSESGQVPDGVIDWYLTNITKTIEIQPNAIIQKNKKSFSKNTGGFQFQSAGGQHGGRKLIENPSELSLGTIPVEETSSQKKQGESLLHDFTAANLSGKKQSQGGFNWLTGTKMNVYAPHERMLNSKKSQNVFSEPILQQSGKSRKGSTTAIAVQKCTTVISPTSQLSPKSLQQL